MLEHTFVLRRVLRLAGASSLDSFALAFMFSLALVPVSALLLTFVFAGAPPVGVLPLVPAPLRSLALVHVALAQALGRP